MSAGYGVSLLHVYESAGAGESFNTTPSCEHNRLLALRSWAPHRQGHGVAGLAAFEQGRHVVQSSDRFVLDGRDDVAGEYLAAVATATRDQPGARRGADSALKAWSPTALGFRTARLGSHIAAAHQHLLLSVMKVLP